MLLGLVSDTHDQIQTTRRAVEWLCQQRVDMLIHCGDLCGPEILELLSVRPAAFVFGNNDFDRPPLLETARRLGINCLHDAGVLELDGRRVGVTHGHLPASHVRTLQPLDYLLTGHTHVSCDRRVGALRQINPGALHRTPHKSVATLDLQTDSLKILPLPAR